MKFECFVFDEINSNHKKTINKVVNEIFEAKSFLGLLKERKLKEVTFSIILVENLVAKKTNSYWRNKNTIPDILSFPFMESEGKKTILGDLMITPKKLEKDYKEISDGYRKLIIHGLLHLLGFDHIKDSEFKKMSLAESNILQELNNY